MSWFVWKKAKKNNQRLNYIIKTYLNSTSPLFIYNLAPNIHEICLSYHNIAVFQSVIPLKADVITAPEIEKKHRIFKIQTQNYLPNVFNNFVHLNLSTDCNVIKPWLELITINLLMVRCATVHSSYGDLKTLPLGKWCH